MTKHCFQLPFGATYILEWVVDLYVQEEEKHRELEIFAHISLTGVKDPGLKSLICFFVYQLPVTSTVAHVFLSKPTWVPEVKGR